jgi:hypothetical protein
MNNYKWVHYIKSLICPGLCLFFATGTAVLFSADNVGFPIPEPLLPVTELGEHKADVENLQNLLKQKKHFEFYKIAQHSIRELHEEQRQAKLFEGKTRGEVMAKEWVCYLIALAPLMEMEEFFTLGKLPEKDDLLVDLFAKTTAMGLIHNTPRGARRESEMKSYKMQYGVDYKELFTPEEIRKIEVAHVAYYAAILKGRRDAYRKASVARKVDGYLPTPGYGTTPITLPSNSVMTIDSARKYFDFYCNFSFSTMSY